MGPESMRLEAAISTNDLIEALIKATSASTNPLHEYVFREALRGLVRLAKAEKMLEIKRDMALAIGISSEQLPRRP